VISLSRNLSPKFPLSDRLKVWSKYILRPKLSLTNVTKVGQICMEEIALIHWT